MAHSSREKKVCEPVRASRDSRSVWVSVFPFGEAEGRVKSCETGCRNAAMRAAP